MPTRRRFLKYAGGATTGSLAWLYDGNESFREVYDLIPGRQGPRETRERPPNQELEPFLAARHSDYDTADRKAVEQRHFEALNGFRDSNGREPVAWSDNLAYMARRHSYEQATEGWTGHLDGADQGWEFTAPDGSPSGTTVGNRLKAYGYRTSKLVAKENTQWKSVYPEQVREKGSLTYLDGMDSGFFAEVTLTNFRESEDHRKAMLSREVDTAGVGVVLADTDYQNDVYGENYLDIYVTQLFTGPKEGYEWVVRS